MNNPSIREAFEKWYSDNRYDELKALTGNTPDGFTVWQAATCAVMQWLPVAEVPYEDRNYLVFDNTVGFRVAYYGRHIAAREPIWLNGGELLRSVTHIMRLPPAPKTTPPSETDNEER